MCSIGIGLSIAILRSEAVEPRKNCFARGWDNAKAYFAQPAMEVTSMLLKAAITIDNFVIEGVSQGVKAVNWVTGMTRTEQSQLVGSLSFIPNAIDNFSNGRISSGIISIAMAGLIYFGLGSFREKEEKELELAKTRIKTKQKSI